MKFVKKGSASLDVRSCFRRLAEKLLAGSRINRRGVIRWQQMIIFFGASSLTFSLTSATLSQQIFSSPSRAIIVAEVQAAVRGASRDLDLLVDPEVALAIASDAQIFVGSFCVDQPGGIPKNNCDDSFSDADVLKGVVTDYLRDLERRLPTVETVSSRLAKLIGTEIEGTGWPGSAPNVIGSITLAEALRSSNIAVSTATGSEIIGPSRRKLLIRPGRVSLTATLDDGQKVHTSLLVRPLETVAWNAQTSLDLSTVGGIGVSPDTYCEQSGEIVRTRALVPYNWGRAKFVESEGTRTAHRAPAAMQSALDITVEDRTGDCGKGCLNGIAIAFARAVAVWRAGCETCDPGALAVVRVGERIWIDRQAVDALRRYLEDGEIEVAKLAAFDNRGLFAAPSLLVPRRLIAPYDQVDNEDELIEAICRIEDAGVPWVSASQGFLCPGVPMMAMPLRPKLTILEELTDCGEGAIACGKPGGDVQITTSSYSFQVAAPGGYLKLGNATSQFDIRPVLLHEVGHWFGLPHPAQVGVDVEDVMASVFQPGRECVSAASLTMVSNAADDRWPFRAKENQGLLAPSSPRAR